MKALLTTSMLINAKSSPGKSKEELVDTYSKDSLGLYCIIKPENNERIPFRLRMKVDGKTKHFPVGYFPDESLEDLRSKAAELRAQILVGHIPVKTGAVSKQQDMNLTTFMEQHYLPFKKDRKRSYVDDQQIWNLRVKPTDLANKKLSAVTRADVEALQSQAIANGKAPATANHIVKLMRHAMNLAVDWGYLDKNPLSGIKMIFEDNMVENYLDDAQLKRLFDVLESMDTVPSKIVGLLATSGLRLNECLSLKWSSVDINNRLLRVDASNSHNPKILGCNQKGCETELSFA